MLAFIFRSVCFHSKGCIQRQNKSELWCEHFKAKFAECQSIHHWNAHGIVADISYRVNTFLCKWQYELASSQFYDRTLWWEPSSVINRHIAYNWQFRIKWTHIWNEAKLSGNERKNTLIWSSEAENGLDSMFNTTVHANKFRKKQPLFICANWAKQKTNTKATDNSATCKTQKRHVCELCTVVA